MTNYAQIERHALADLLDRVGPDVATLCGTWTSADLAAHLVVRERRPDGAVGILVPALSARGEKVRLAVRDAHRWPDLVDKVRRGPPLVIRPLDAAINTVEFFVHHEDVRRASGEVEARPVPAGEEAALWSRLGLMGRLLFKASPVGVEMIAAEHGRARCKGGAPSVTVTGAPSELVLFAFGRQAQAIVELEGDDLSVSQLRAAPLGI